MTAKILITALLASAWVAGAARAQSDAPVSIADSAAKTAATQMAKLDIDKDGRITTKEWTDGGAAADRFAPNDANKDGVITLEELQAGGRAALAALDLDKDGQISTDEIRASARAMIGGRGPGSGRPPSPAAAPAQSSPADVSRLLVVGATITGSDGIPIGKVEAVGGRDVTVKLAWGRTINPSPESLHVGPNGLAMELTAERIRAMTGGSTTN